jgi:hypothetical protein
MKISEQDKYLLNPFISYKSKFFTFGFKSKKIFISSSKTLDLNIFCNVACELQVTGSDLPHENNGGAGSSLLFTKTLAANETFYKSFVPKSSYITIEVKNTNSQEGLLLLQGYCNYEKEFAAQSHLEGKIFERDNCVLIREASNFETDLIAGNIDYAQQINITGYSETNNGGTPYILGYNGVGTPSYSQTPLELFIECLSTDDRLAGVGAQIVKMTYLDSDFIERVVNVDCVASGSTGFTGFTVNKLEVIQVGSSLSNQGRIKIKNNAGSVLYSLIETNENVSNNFNYQVPIQKSLILKDLNIHGISSNSTLLLQEFETATNQLKTLGKFKINTTNINSSIPINFLIQQKNKIMIQVVPSAIVLPSEFIQCKLSCELLRNKGDF